MEIFRCQTCGLEILGTYAAIGGNIGPYVPSKIYHLGCLPKFQVYPGPIEEQLDKIFRTPRAGGWIWLGAQARRRRSGSVRTTGAEAFRCILTTGRKKWAVTIDQN